jgi:chromate transporter
LPHGIAGATIGLIAIFLPGILVLMGVLPFWETFRRRAGAQATMRAQAARLNRLEIAISATSYSSAQEHRISAYRGDAIIRKTVDLPRQPFIAGEID